MTDERRRLDRRRFLLLAGGAAAVVVGLGLRLGLDDGDAPTSGGSRSSPPGTPDAATEAIGRRYLEATPTESTEEDLRDALPAELAGLTPGEQSSEENARLAAAARADFDEGETVELDGWLLSVTECRVAALSVVA